MKRHGRWVAWSLWSLWSVAATAFVTTMAEPRIALAADDGSIRGVVKDGNSGEPIGEALVILQCSCLTAERETSTNERGIYRFENLPPGNYTVQVLYGKANVSKVTQLPRAAQFRANFAIDPKKRVRARHPGRGQADPGRYLHDHRSRHGAGEEPARRRRHFP